jgi:hypothetical protein
MLYMGIPVMRYFVFKGDSLVKLLLTTITSLITFSIIMTFLISRRGFSNCRPQYVYIGLVSCNNCSRTCSSCQWGTLHNLEFTSARLLCLHAHSLSLSLSLSVKYVWWKSDLVLQMLSLSVKYILYFAPTNY